MPVGQLTLSVDSAPMTAAAAEARALLDQSPPWLRWLAVQAFENFEYTIDLVHVDGMHISATGARELRTVAQPADKLVLWLAALRAGNGQSSGIVGGEFDAHGGSYGK